MTEVLSIRLDDELYRSLKEIGNYQETLKEYIRFLVETEGKSSSSVKEFLNTILSGKDVKSPAYLTITMLTKGVAYSDIKTTIERATENNEEAIIASNMIVEKWDKIIKATSERPSFLRSTLSIELRKRSDYYHFLSTMREEMEKLENEHPNLFFIVAEYIYANRSDYRTRGEYMFYMDKIQNHLRRIFGEDEYESIIRGFLRCGAANINTLNTRTAFWVGMRFNEVGKKHLEEIREKRVEEKNERMEKEIGDHLFDLIISFIDTKSFKPYEKIIGTGSELFNNLDKLVQDNWILVEDGKYGTGTYVSPASINIIESYALKRI